MLCLTRKLHEAIVIDGGIRVVVSRIKGGKVYLSIDAPPETRIMREEILDPLAVEVRKDGIVDRIAKRLQLRDFVSADGDVCKFAMTRREDEIAVVGGIVRVRVTKISGGRVRLEFEAPRSISVERDELAVVRELTV